MKVVVDIRPGIKCVAEEALNVLTDCLAANGVRNVPIHNGRIFNLWKPTPIDDLVPLETLDRVVFHPDEVLSARYDDDGGGGNVIFVSLFFSEVDVVSLVEIETDGPWVPPERDCREFEVPWREWSEKLYSIATCLHQAFKAEETRGYYDETPDDPHFLLTHENAV